MNLAWTVTVFMTLRQTKIVGMQAVLPCGFTSFGPTWNESGMAVQRMRDISAKLFLESRQSGQVDVVKYGI